MPTQPTPMQHDRANDRDERVRRQAAYERLLTCTAGRPQPVYEEICGALRDYSRAPMVALWLYNSFSDEFELVCMSTASGQNGYAQRPRPGGGSICALAAAEARAQLIEDVAKFAVDRGGVTYRAATTDALQTLGYGSMVVVPLLNPPAADPKTGGPRPHEGVISLHYPRLGDVPESVRPGEDVDSDKRNLSLLLLGRMTANLIARLRRDQQVSVGRRLNELADEHLRRFTADPRVVRYDYVQAVIAIIREVLEIDSISMFWRSEFSQDLSCIGTTGLWDSQEKKRITTRTQLDLINYPVPDGPDALASDSWTVRVLRAGEPMILNQEQSAAHERSERYLDKLSESDPASTALIAPMPWPADGKPAIGCHGVIRCGHLRHRLFKQELSMFDQVELQLLRAIVGQVTPILLTLDSRIVRENSISSVKHDMAASLDNIRNLVDEIEAESESPDEAKNYNLRNLREAALSLDGLVGRLARDYGSHLVTRPGKINVESQVVAPLKRILYPYAKEEGILDIRYDFEEDFPLLNIDPKLFQHALMNILVNAIKYGEKGKAIRVFGHAVPEGVAIDVSNLGAGIEPDEVQHLFKMYFRGRATRVRASTGSGLGLALARQNLRSMGADLLLHQARGPTIFRMFFPARLTIPVRAR